MRKALSSLLIVISMGVNAQTKNKLDTVKWDVGSGNQILIELAKPKKTIQIDTTYGLLEFWTQGNEKPDKKVFDGYQVKRTETYPGERYSLQQQ